MKTQIKWGIGVLVLVALVAVGVFATNSNFMKGSLGDIKKLNVGDLRPVVANECGGTSWTKIFEVNNDQISFGNSTKLSNAVSKGCDLKVVYSYLGAVTLKDVFSCERIYAFSSGGTPEDQYSFSCYGPARIRNLNRNQTIQGISFEYNKLLGGQQPIQATRIEHYYYGQDVDTSNNIIDGDGTKIYAVYSRS